jgi:hypothetical protein
MRWYQKLWKPIATLWDGVGTILDGVVDLVSGVLGGATTVVGGATVAVSDICGDVANATNGIGNAVNNIGTNIPFYLIGGALLGGVILIATTGDKTAPAPQASSEPQRDSMEVASSDESDLEPEVNDAAE